MPSGTSSTPACGHSDPGVLHFCKASRRPLEDRGRGVENSPPAEEGPLLAEPTTGFENVATIVGDDGTRLALVDFAPGNDTSVLTVARVHNGKGRLLGYYFARGKRGVRVEAGVISIPGVLRTEWAGAERRWRISLAFPGQRMPDPSGESHSPAA